MRLRERAFSDHRRQLGTPNEINLHKMSTKSRTSLGALNSVIGSLLPAGTSVLAKYTIGGKCEWFHGKITEYDTENEKYDVHFEWDGTDDSFIIPSVR